MTRVEWTRRALATLDEISDYIAKDDPNAAQRMAERVFDAVDHLLEHPAMGRMGRLPGTRELVVTGTPYLVPYRVTGDVVEILRVFHGAQRWPEEL